MRVRVRRQRRAAPAVRRGPRVAPGRRGAGFAPAASVEVGGALDPAERAADRVAARVMGADSASRTGAVAGSGVAVHRMCAGCTAEEDGHREEARRAVTAAPTVAPGATAAPAPPAAAAAIAGLGTGSPLSRAERQFFEPRFGRDLGGVRLHEDAAARRAVRALDARAFARGRDIGLAPGARDRPTLAHELAHVVATDGKTRRQQPAAPAPAAPAPRQPHVLTAAERQEAQTYNSRRFEDPFTIVIAKETMGVARYPGVIDDAFIDATAAWQFQHNETEDGKFGPVTTQSVIAAMLAGGSQRFADLLRGDNLVRAVDTVAPTFNACPGGPPGTPFVGFRWEVAFRTSLRNGFIVQRVDNTWAETPAPVSGVAPPTVPRYWEAWPVNGAGAITHPKHASGADDRWQRAVHNNSRGQWTMAGTLYTVLNLPAQFAAQGAANHAPDAGGLRSAIALSAANIDGLGLPEGFAAIQIGDERARRIGGAWDCTAAVPFNRRA